MSDVIERLLEVEQEARRAIEEAEKEADRILAEAREKARRIRAEGREEARRQAQELFDEHAEKLRQQRRERVQAEQDRLPSPRELDPEKLDEAAQFAVHVIAHGDDGS